MQRVDCKELCKSQRALCSEQLCSEKCCTFAAVISKGMLDSLGKNAEMFTFQLIEFLIGVVFSACFPKTPSPGFI